MASRVQPRSINRYQNDLRQQGEHVERQIQASAIVSGALIEGVKLATLENTVVTHRLGRMPRGWCIANNDGLRGATYEVSRSSSQLVLRTAKEALHVRRISPAAAGVNDDEAPVWHAHQGITILDAHYVPGATIAANLLNYATLNLYKRNADGTSQALIATASTLGVAPGADWAAFVAHALTLTAANRSLTTGQILTTEIIKTGGGVVVSAGTWDIDYYYSGTVVSLWVF